VLIERSVLGEKHLEKGLKIEGLPFSAKVKVNEEVYCQEKQQAAKASRKRQRFNWYK
jgi:hypothetical protein